MTVHCQICHRLFCAAPGVRDNYELCVFDASEMSYRKYPISFKTVAHASFHLTEIVISRIARIL